MREDWTDGFEDIAPRRASSKPIPAAVPDAAGNVHPAERGRSYFANAFALSMFDVFGHCGITVNVRSVQSADLPEEMISVVGHQNTAELLSGVLGRQVGFCRCTLQLSEYDTLYVAQYVGPRLPEGATSLPEGAGFQLYRVQQLESGE